MEKLKTDWWTNKATLTLLDPLERWPEQQMSSLTVVDLKIRDSQLLLYAFFRSQNALNAYGNMYGLRAIHWCCTERLGVAIGPITLFVSSPHVFERDLERAKHIGGQVLRLIVTLLGSSIAEGAEADDAYELGKRIGAASHILKNGGYGGTMAARARGCREAGGHVIGVGIKGHAIDRTGAAESLQLRGDRQGQRRGARRRSCSAAISSSCSRGTSARWAKCSPAWVCAIEGRLPRASCWSARS